MMTNRTHLLLSLVACTSVACATASETPAPEPVQPTAEIGPVDSMIFADSAAPDTSVTDAVAEADRCVYPATETKPCGYCGTTTRFCLPEGVWTGFTACTGEIGSAECKVGDKRTEPCGNCGSQTDYCDVKTCTWTSGYCAGEGPCAEGDEETTKASCPVSGEVRTRTCDSKCQWSDFSACALPRGWLPMETSPLLGRQRHTAVWTGSKMIVWGGYNGATSPYYQNDGASYDPLSNKWTKLASGPLSIRREHAAVWTGSKMIVFGGRDGSSVFKDGAVYDPATDTWTSIAAAPLTARLGVAAVWSPSTGEMIVWGGCTGTTCGSVAADGAAYKPDTNAWTTLPAAPIAGRGDMVYALVKGELVVFGGRNASSAGLGDGARFDPLTRSWTKFSGPTAWTPRLEASFTATADGIALFGGRTGTSYSSYVGDGLIYTPMVGISAMAPLADADFSPSAKRHFPAMWFADGKVYLYSGIPLSSWDASSGFAAYDTASGSWTKPSTTSMLSPRANPTVVWTGKEALIWGGAEEDLTSPYYNTGGIYRP